MKRIDKYFALIALTTLAVAGCSKSNVDNNLGVVPNPDIEQDGRAIITLRSGSKMPSSKVAYNYDGENISLSWELYDKVTLFNSEDGLETDFELVKSSAGVNEGKFLAVNEDYILESGTYKIYYPATLQIPSGDHTIETTTQLSSGDASHLKSQMILRNDNVTVNAKGEINATLTSAQCVVAATLINVLPDMIPTGITYECAGESVEVNLESHEAGSSSVTLLIPANPKSLGDVANFEVRYTDGTGEHTYEDSTTLTQTQEPSKIYNYAINMDPNTEFTIVEESVNSDSGSIYINIPVSDVVENAGNAADFSVTVINGGEEFSGITVAGVEKGQGGSMLTLSLSDKIYSDDVVKVSYNGTSVKNKHNKELTAFTVDNILPVAKNLISAESLSMYDFEGDDKRCANNSLKVFEPTEADKSSGSRSLHYDSTLDASTLATPKAIMYYIGSKNLTTDNMPLRGLESNTTYITRFDIKMINAGEMDIQVRYKGYLPNTTTPVAGDQSFSIGEIATTNEWVECDVETMMSIYAAQSTTDGYLSIKISGTFTTAPVGEFYIDNIRIYKKSDLLRPSTTTGGVGVGDLTEEDF